MFVKVIIINKIVLPRTQVLLRMVSIPKRGQLIPVRIP